MLLLNDFPGLDSVLGGGYTISPRLQPALNDSTINWVVFGN